MRSKIYRVTRDDGATFLVEANNRLVAVNHIARTSHTAELASQHDLVAAVRAGAVIQRAGEAEAD